jgi:multidrug efflux pump
VVIYIVLGILYESLMHPITVLSTLPSAGVGAVLALLMFKLDFSIIALIGVFLLIGIVKKNAILIIDFALEARTRARHLGDGSRARSLPAALPPHPDDHAGRHPGRAAAGDRLRRRRRAAPPLGIAIIGGLIASQVLTLLTTPVVYVLMDKLRRRSPGERQLAAIPTRTTQRHPTLRCNRNDDKYAMK